MYSPSSLVPPIRERRGAAVATVLHDIVRLLARLQNDRAIRSRDSQAQRSGAVLLSKHDTEGDIRLCFHVKSRGIRVFGRPAADRFGNVIAAVGASGPAGVGGLSQPHVHNVVCVFDGEVVVARHLGVEIALVRQVKVVVRVGLRTAVQRHAGPFLTVESNTLVCCRVVGWRHIFGVCGVHASDAVAVGLVAVVGE